MENQTVGTLDGAEFTIDQEAFRRVWERVMPDQSLSPITLKEGEASPPPPKVEEGVDPNHYIAGLEGVMDAVRQWQSKYEGLSRRAGGKSGVNLRNLAGLEGQQLRTLSSIYFLLTGGHYLPRTQKAGCGGVKDSLREGFLAEMELEKQYAHLAEKLADPVLRACGDEMSERSRQIGRGILRMV